VHRETPTAARALASPNLYFYLAPVTTLLPSFATQPVGFAAPKGYRPLNPSVVRQGEEILLVQRTVNYTLTEDGLKYQTPDNAPIHTRNFLLRLNEALEIKSAVELLTPAD